MQWKSFRTLWGEWKWGKQRLPEKTSSFIRSNQTQVESATKEALGEIAEFLVGNVKTSTEATNTAELIKALTLSKVTLSEYDELIITFNRGKTLGKVRTTFPNKNNNIEKVINEIKALRGFINSKITKAGTLGNNVKIKLIMNKALKNLEEAVTDFSEL